jgi:hypothetical protein
VRTNNSIYLASKLHWCCKKKYGLHFNTSSISSSELCAKSSARSLANVNRPHQQTQQTFGPTNAAQYGATLRTRTNERNVRNERENRQDVRNVQRVLFPPAATRPAPIRFSRRAPGPAGRAAFGFFQSHSSSKAIVIV